MNIKLRYRFCGQHIAAPHQVFGTSIRCPSCIKEFEAGYLSIIGYFVDWFRLRIGVLALPSQGAQTYRLARFCSRFIAVGVVVACLFAAALVARGFLSRTTPRQASSQLHSSRDSLPSQQIFLTPESLGKNYNSVVATPVPIPDLARRPNFTPGSLANNNNPVIATPVPTPALARRPKLTNDEQDIYWNSSDPDEQPDRFLPTGKITFGSEMWKFRNLLGTVELIYIDRKLSFDDFPELKNMGDYLYQIHFTRYSMYGNLGDALLVTSRTKFESSGRADFTVAKKKTIHVLGGDGFEKTVAVFRQPTQEDIDLYNAERDKRLKRFKDLFPSAVAGPDY